MATIIPSPLYHADQEHDACGVGLIARVSGERSHDVIDKAPSPRSRPSRTAAPSTPMPSPRRRRGHSHADPRRAFPRAPERGQEAALSRRRPRRCHDFPPARRPTPRRTARNSSSKPPRLKVSLGSVGAPSPTDNSGLGRKALETQPVMVQALIGRVGELTDDEFERKLFLVQKTAERKVFEAGVEGLLYLLLFVAHDCLQRPRYAAPDPEIFHRPQVAALHQRLCDFPPALLDEHVPHVAPRASVPDDRAQRRDQHDPRQPESHARPRAQRRARRVGRPLRRPPPARAAGHERFRLLRQRPPTPHARRPRIRCRPR